VTTTELRCPGCGAKVADVPELRTDHLYVGAIAGCWSAYTALMGRQLSDPRLAGVHMLAVDVYMAQHPGTPGRQASQSVWVHLVGLCLVLEHGFDVVASARAKARVAAPDAVFECLEPPASLGAVTVLDMFETGDGEKGDGEKGAASVRRWAESVWDAWSPHHDAIRGRAAEPLKSPR
jgi:hypothetical protein